MKRLTFFAGVAVAVAILAGCSLVDLSVKDYQKPSQIWQEQHVPFIDGTYWMPLAPSDGTIVMTTVFVYGKDQSGSVLSSDGTMDVVALFKALPQVSSQGTIQNPEDCFWVWHNGMGGTRGAPLYADGCPVFGGAIQYDRAPTIPPETAPGVTLTVPDVFVVAWQKGSDGTFWYSSSAVTWTIALQ